MARIKIENINENTRISESDLKKIKGGIRQISNLNQIGSFSQLQNTSLTSFGNAGIITPGSDPHNIMIITPGSDPH